MCVMMLDASFSEPKAVEVEAVRWERYSFNPDAEDQNTSHGI